MRSNQVDTRRKSILGREHGNARSRGCLACAGSRMVSAEWQEGIHRGDEIGKAVGARSDGPWGPQQELGLHSEWGEPLSLWILARWVWGFYSGCFPFRELSQHQQLPWGSISTFLPTPTYHKWLQSKDTSCWSFKITSCWSFPAASYPKGAPYPGHLEETRKVTNEGRDIA